MRKRYDFSSILASSIYLRCTSFDSLVMEAVLRINALSINSTEAEVQGAEKSDERVEIDITTVHSDFYPESYVHTRCIVTRTLRPLQSHEHFALL
jgi:hypothetical protein